jgi:hypothetical protein
MTRIIRIAAYVGLLLVASGSKAYTSTITIDAYTRGWYTSTDHAVAASDANYIAGFCVSCTPPLTEYRDFFDFFVPPLDGLVVDATLILDSGGVAAEQFPTMTYEVTSLSSGAFGFNDLGTGTFYGNRDYSAADQQTQQSIALDAAALDAIAALPTGSTFGIGGRITTLRNGDTRAEDIFLFTDNREGCPTLPCRSQLRITTAPPAPVPEPATLTLTALGLAGVVSRYRRRRAAR